MKNWNLHMVISLAIAILLTGAFGSVLTEYFRDTSSGQMALHMLGATGGGWVLLCFLGRMKLDGWKAYLRELGKIMSVGVLILLPSILLINPSFHPIWLPLANVAISFTVMLYMNIRLCQKLKLSYNWTLNWFLSLGSISLTWTSLFLLA
jgi:hypothetical protein